MSLHTHLTTAPSSFTKQLCPYYVLCPSPMSYVGDTLATVVVSSVTVGTSSVTVGTSSGTVRALTGCGRHLVTVGASSGTVGPLSHCGNPQSLWEPSVTVGIALTRGFWTTLDISLSLTPFWSTYYTATFGHLFLLLYQSSQSIIVVKS